MSADPVVNRTRRSSSFIARFEPVDQSRMIKNTMSSIQRFISNPNDENTIQSALSKIRVLNNLFTSLRTKVKEKNATYLDLKNVVYLGILTFDEAPVNFLQLMLLNVDRVRIAAFILEARNDPQSSKEAQNLRQIALDFSLYSKVLELMPENTDEMFKTIIDSSIYREAKNSMIANAETKIAEARKEIAALQALDCDDVKVDPA